MTKGYILAEVEVTDAKLFEEYRAQVAATLRPFGGHFLIRGGDPARLEGEQPLHRFVLLEFDSPERAREWYHSKPYQDILPLRLRSSRADVVLLNGVAPA